MRIHHLELKNVGPFRDANLEFIRDGDNLDKPPVIIITGENGTGKTIVLDAIRALCYGGYDSIEREIVSADDFLIKSQIELENQIFDLSSIQKGNRNSFFTSLLNFNSLFSSSSLPNKQFKDNFVVDYWTSKLSNDSFSIKNIESPKTEKHLIGALSGIHQNSEVTKTITFFDYLSDSKDLSEKAIGSTLLSIIKDIINLSINEGYLSHVSRVKLQPIIKIGENEISLDKLSSGNLYLIQRFISLLKKMYAVCVTHQIPINQIQEINGLLLIDEAENHLHPKWQKVFIGNIQRIFPNLQIIATTHSPFIVSSVENSRVYVCSSKGDYSIITEETDLYANMPIEEILRSPLFNTDSFNKDISDLLHKRNDAISKHDFQTKEAIEKELLAINPEYFNYFHIDQMLKEMIK